MSVKAVIVMMAGVVVLLCACAQYIERVRRDRVERHIDRRLTQLEHQVAELRGQAESISRDMTVRVGELERRARQAEAPDPMDLFKEDDWNES